MTTLVCCNEEVFDGDSIAMVVNQYQHLNQPYLQLKLDKLDELIMPITRIIVLIHPYSRSTNKTKRRGWISVEDIVKKVYWNNHQLSSSHQIELLYLSLHLMSAITHSLTRQVDDISGLGLHFGWEGVSVVPIVCGRILARDAVECHWIPAGSRLLLDTFKYLIMKHTDLTMSESVWIDMMMRVCTLDEECVDIKYWLNNEFIIVPGWIRSAPLKLWFSSGLDLLKEFRVDSAEWTEIKASNPELAKGWERSDETSLDQIISSALPLLPLAKVDLFLSGPLSDTPGLEDRLRLCVPDRTSIVKSPLTQNHSNAHLLGGCLVTHINPVRKQQSLVDQLSKRLSLGSRTLAPVNFIAPEWQFILTFTQDQRSYIIPPMPEWTLSHVDQDVLCCGRGWWMVEQQSHDYSSGHSTPVDDGSRRQSTILQRKRRRGWKLAKGQWTKQD
jgi:hypothetical protein